MGFAVSQNRSSASLTLSSQASDNSGSAGRAGPPTQSYDDLADRRIALSQQARAEGVAALNLILADTMTLRDLYRKHRWQTSGATFYELHRLFEKHHDGQEELVDGIAERIQILGGVSIAMGADVAETTMLARPPRDREEPSLQLARLIDAHERVLYAARAAAWHAAELDDDGTRDLLASGVIRTNEKQAWFVYEHLQRGRLSRAS
jgi:starvation-inducible DNA-binding protein